MRLEMMNKFQSKILCLTLLVALLSFGAQTARAQSTLVTIPSTDVVLGKNVYLEFDFISHYASHHNGAFKRTSRAGRSAPGTT